jgi:hypothetical protein
VPRRWLGPGREEISVLEVREGTRDTNESSDRLNHQKEFAYDESEGLVRVSQSPQPGGQEKAVQSACVSGFRLVPGSPMSCRTVNADCDFARRTELQHEARHGGVALRPDGPRVFRSTILRPGTGEFVRLL